MMKTYIIFLFFFYVSHVFCSQCSKNLIFHASDPGFTPSNLETISNYFFSNLNIQGKGGIVASPDKKTPVGGGTYYYDWMRDGALSMRAFMELHDFDLNSIQNNMQSYVQWILNSQNQNDPLGFDIRIEPKFNLPNGDVFQGGWGRPQTDGPGLRSTTLILYALKLIENGQKDYVAKYLWTGDANKYHGGAIKYDLDWLVQGVNQVVKSFDLWEDLSAEDFFWNKINWRRAFVLGAQLAEKMGDHNTQQIYVKCSGDLATALQNHWNSTGEFIFQAPERPIDGAVIIGLNQGYSDDDFLPPIDVKIAKTVLAYNELFCEIFPINQKDTDNGVPGVMYGRYAGDVYQNGNPWQLISANLATLFYRASEYIYSNLGSFKVVNDEEFQAWQTALNLETSSSFLDDRDRALAQSFLSAGDAVLKRIYYHVKGDNFHISEQIDKNSGYQISAKDLTWSYGDVIFALKTRSKVVPK